LKNTKHIEQTQLLEDAYSYFINLLCAYSLNHLKEGVRLQSTKNKTHIEIKNKLDILVGEEILNKVELTDYSFFVITKKGCDVGKALLDIRKL